jgi:hypothetical protein
MSHADERVFRPVLSEEDSGSGVSIQLARLKGVVAIGETVGALELCRELRKLTDMAAASADQNANQADLRLAVAASLLADLCEQEWRVWLRGDDIVVAPPNWSRSAAYTADQIKSRVRNGLQIASDRQIATEAVQRFIASMEQTRIFKSRIVSIANLIDDGRDLSDRLRAMLASDRAGRERELTKLIQPYVQVCADGDACEFTGLPLMDVWRYLRHTWSLEYNPLPGRTMRFLVRNSARPDHPVIGIAMLASPAANLYVRDGWIGWRLDDVIRGLHDGTVDAAEVGKSLWSTIRAAIADIRSDDLISSAELRAPTQETIFKLRQIAGLAHGKRRRDLQEFEADADLFEGVIDIRAFARRPVDWKVLSESPLFLRKRAEQLIPLLRAYAYMRKAEFHSFPDAALYETLVTRDGRAIITFCLGELRKRKLATEVADLSVCGAIAPYNHLVAGKLVTLLMASKEVQQAYAKRYQAQESEIASQMAGRPIIRAAKLSVVTTTSLYGISSSQYNRLKLKELGVEWSYIGETKGMTITHVSKKTLALMKRLGIKQYGATRINSVFGEGSSPKTRQIREGLNLIGINNDHVLMQSIGRRVYACEVAPGAKRSLMGLPLKFKHRHVDAKLISKSWVNRWVVDRALNIDVLERMRTSTAASISQQFQERKRRGDLTEISQEAEASVIQSAGE